MLNISQNAGVTSINFELDDVGKQWPLTEIGGKNVSTSHIFMSLTPPREPDDT